MTKVAPAARAESVSVAPVFEKCYRYEVANRVRQAGHYSFFRVVESAQEPVVAIGGRKLIMLGSNNYLGLTNDPRVKEAAIEAIRKYGSGCAGSRFLNGTLELHLELERRLARFMGAEAALTFTTGYQANVGTISGSGAMSPSMEKTPSTTISRPFAFPSLPIWRFKSAASLCRNLRTAPNERRAPSMMQA